MIPRRLLAVLGICFFSTSFLACAHRPPSPLADAKDHDASSGPTIVNLGPQFTTFWEAAREAPFEKQLALWERIVEGPNQELYASLVWNTDEDPDWKERRLARLHVAFQQYRKYAPEMKKRFREFGSVLATQIRRFREYFPDARLALPIYALPSPTFDGKAGSLQSRPEQNVLAFGMEQIVDNGDDPDVLYAHELFHVYLAEKIGLNQKVSRSKGKFTLPLWDEGFATYVSELLNPKAPLSKILLDTRLAELSPHQIPRLASRYLAHANEPAVDERNPQNYKRWFTTGGVRLESDLPYRCGYFLGLELLRHLAKAHSLAELVSWHLPEMHVRVVEALKEMRGS